MDGVDLGAGGPSLRIILKTNFKNDLFPRIISKN